MPLHIPIFIPIQLREMKSWDTDSFGKLIFEIREPYLAKLGFPWHNTEPNKISFPVWLIKTVKALHLLQLFLRKSLIGPHTLSSSSILRNLLHLHHGLLQWTAWSQTGNGKDQNTDSQKGGRNQQHSSYEIITHENDLFLCTLAQQFKDKPSKTESFSHAFACQVYKPQHFSCYRTLFFI